MMSSADDATIVNPYAPPNTGSAVGQRIREDISLRAAFGWLAGIAVLQAVMATSVINSLQSRVPVIDTRLATVHLILMVVVALCATAVLLWHYTAKSALRVAELINVTQWITLPLSCWFLRLVGFTEVTIHERDVWIFVQCWVGCALAITVVCGVTYLMQLRRRNKVPD